MPVVADGNGKDGRNVFARPVVTEKSWKQVKKVEAISQLMRHAPNYDHFKAQSTQPLQRDGIVIWTPSQPPSNRPSLSAFRGWNMRHGIGLGHSSAFDPLDNTRRKCISPLFERAMPSTRGPGQMRQRDELLTCNDWQLSPCLQLLTNIWASGDFIAPCSGNAWVSRSTLLSAWKFSLESRYEV